MSRFDFTSVPDPSGFLHWLGTLWSVLSSLYVFQLLFFDLGWILSRANIHPVRRAHERFEDYMWYACLPLLGWLLAGLSGRRCRAARLSAITVLAWYWLIYGSEWLMETYWNTGRWPLPF